MKLQDLKTIRYLYKGEDMGAIQKKEGHQVESSPALHQMIQEFTNCNKVSVDGSSRTKVDIRTDLNINFSHKFASNSNTQVYLPTLKSWNEKIPMPTSVLDKLSLFFGSHAWDMDEIEQKLGVTLSSEEKRRHRVHSNNIYNFAEVVEWMNKNLRELLILMVRELDPSDPVHYIIWSEKNKNTSTIVDVNKFIDYVSATCKWTALDTTFEIRDPATEKRLFHLQMKGSGKKTGDYHNPMFHIHNNWPESTVLEKRNDFNIR